MTHQIIYIGFDHQVTKLFGDVAVTNTAEQLEGLHAPVTILLVGDCRKLTDWHYIVNAIRKLRYIASNVQVADVLPIG